MANSLQGVYTPIPQYLSDSDSEKEVSVRMEPVCVNYANNGSKSAKFNNFASDRHNGHLFFNESNDDIHKIKRINPKMSNLRRVAFSLSIVLCFLPIIIFLWLLPCSDTNTCSVHIPNWAIQKENIELQGKINLVHGAFKSNWNLAVMYKGSFNTLESQKNGIVCFVGSSGALAWDFKQKSIPEEMNCSIIDVDGNGFNDCLVTDQRGLKAIETITGEAMWHAHSVQEQSITELDMPVGIDDLNGDGISELLSVYRKESFLIISGKTGEALSNIKIPSRCSMIANLTRVNQNIRYYCRNSNDSITIYEIPFADVKLKFENSHTSILPKQVHCEDNLKVFQAGNRKLTAENYGRCPHCQAIVSLLDSNNTKLKSWLYQNAIIMTPVTFSLRPSKANIASLHNHLHWFVFKIWQWQQNSIKLSPMTKVYRRSVPVHNETYHLNQVLEQIVLITFHENDTKVINVSMTDIYLICNGPAYDNCQPDYEDQQDSVIITDLNLDGSLELISYYSSYMKKEENGYESWNLVSNLNVFRLEDELPKLYRSE